MASRRAAGTQREDQFDLAAGAAEGRGDFLGAAALVGQGINLRVPRVGLVGGHHGVWQTGGFTLVELLSRCTIHVSSLYRRELWADVGGYDPRFVESCEDWDLWLGAAKRGWTGAARRCS